MTDLDKQDQDLPQNPTQDAPIIDELSMLKQRADLMGIKYAPNISLDTLKERVNKVMAEESDPQIQSSAESTSAVNDPYAEERAQQSALVRVIVVCHDPSKNHLESELLAVENDLVRDKRVVFFGKEWHITRALLESLRDRKYQAFRKLKTAQGEVHKPYLVPAYSIQELAPLTESELAQIARKQLADGLGDQT